LGRRDPANGPVHVLRKLPTVTKLSLSVSVRRRTIRLLPGPERFPRRNPCPLHPAAPDFDALVELKTVCHALSRSRASIYRDIERGGFAFRSALAIISSQSIVSFMPLLPDQVDFADAPVNRRGAVDRARQAETSGFRTVR